MNLAELNLHSTAWGNIEFGNNVIGYLDEEISKQIIKRVIWFLQNAHSKI